MKRVVRAEWAKLWSVPAHRWLVVAVAVLTAAAGAVVTATVDVRLCATPTTCDEDTVKLTLAGVWAGQVAAAVVGALVVTGEYGSRTIRTTFTAEPRRLVVLGAKGLVVGVAVLTAALVGVAGALAAGRAILVANGFSTVNGYPPLTLGEAGTARAAAGTALYITLVAVLALGIGALVKDTAVGLSGVFALLFLVPLVNGFVSDPVWQERLQRFSPATAGLAIQATRDLDALPISPWAGLAVLGAYAGLALTAGGARLVARDA